MCNYLLATGRVAAIQLDASPLPLKAYTFVLPRTDPPTVIVELLTAITFITFVNPNS